MFAAARVHGAGDLLLAHAFRQRAVLAEGAAITLPARIGDRAAVAVRRARGGRGRDLGHDGTGVATRRRARRRGRRGRRCADGGRGRRRGGRRSGARRFWRRRGRRRRRWRRRRTTRRRRRCAAHLRARGARAQCKKQYGYEYTSLFRFGHAAQHSATFTEKTKISRSSFRAASRNASARMTRARTRSVGHDTRRAIEPSGCVYQPGSS
jgi:hypothetical protein